MPYDDPEPDDPHLLVGVSLPGDEAATREMAGAFADEFAQMGFDRERLLHLFTSPFYSGAHAARELLDLFGLVAGRLDHGRLGNQCRHVQECKLNAMARAALYPGFLDSVPEYTEEYY